MRRARARGGAGRAKAEGGAQGGWLNDFMDLARAATEYPHFGSLSGVVYMKLPHNNIQVSQTTQIPEVSEELNG